MTRRVHRTSRSVKSRASKRTRRAVRRRASRRTRRAVRRRASKRITGGGTEPLAKNQVYSANDPPDIELARLIAHGGYLYDNFSKTTKGIIPEYKNKPENWVHLVFTLDQTLLEWNRSNRYNLRATLSDTDKLTAHVKEFFKTQKSNKVWKWGRNAPKSSKNEKDYEFIKKIASLINFGRNSPPPGPP